MHPARILSLIACALLIALPACADDLPSLAQVYAGKFRFGFGGTNDYPVRTELIKPDSPIRRIVETQSNIIGINCFYPAIVRPQATGWKWDNCEQLVTFADQHPDWPRRGHALFWPSQRTAAYNLEWLIKDEAGQLVSRDEAIKRLREHIHTVVSRYKGRIQYWDVVNEAIDAQQPGGLHKNAWSELIGPEMIEIAFRAAREADPQAKLFYNDNNEWRPAKRDQIYRLVRNLKAKGLIDGLGLQQHVHLNYPAVRELNDAFNYYADLGVELHVTELDVEVNPTLRLTSFSPELAQEQAERYRDLFKLYQRHAGLITAVMTWNVTDSSSWLKRYPQEHATWPLLFDAQGQPKPAFWAIAR